MSNKEYSGNKHELFPGTLRGYRAWLIHFKNLKLKSTHMDEIWKPGDNKAKCASNFDPFRKRHPVPYEDCTCGFYARYKWSDLRDITSHAFAIYGAIDVYGTLCLGTRGLRAEKAKIVALTSNGLLDHRIVDLISQEYNVPLFKSMDKLMKEFPPSDYSDLIPKVVEQPKLDFKGLSELLEKFGKTYQNYSSYTPTTWISASSNTSGNQIYSYNPTTQTITYGNGGDFTFHFDFTAE